MDSYCHISGMTILLLDNGFRKGKELKGVQKYKMTFSGELEACRISTDSWNSSQLGNLT